MKNLLILNFLQEIDNTILLLINGAHTSFLDHIMYLISDRYIWIPLYFILAILVAKSKKPLEAVLIIALILTAVGLSDYVCASIIRPFAERLRPSNLNNPVHFAIHIVNGYRGGTYGFPSCHAANTFSLALFLTLIFRCSKLSAAIITWSLTVCYSRIYLGVHYPSDIMGGMLVGSFFAITFHGVYRSIMFLCPLVCGILRNRIDTQRSKPRHDSYAADDKPSAHLSC